MDDGETEERNDTEAGKTRQLFPTRREVRLYEGLLVCLPSPENNNRCGRVEGWLGQRSEYDGAVRPARQHSRPRGGGSRQSRRRLFERLEQEEQRLKKHDGRWMDIQQSLLVRQPVFLGKVQICGKQHTTHLPLFLIMYNPLANS